MSRPRIRIVRTLGIALVSVVLCAIFASELPELLSLSDNTANDFTTRSPGSFVSPVLGDAKSVRQAVVDLNSSQDLLFGRLGSAEKAELAPSRLFILDILRT